MENNKGLDVESLAYKVYAKAGQDAVFIWADEMGIKEQAYCAGCEVKSPVYEGSCLVCGLKILEDETNSMYKHTLYFGQSKPLNKVVTEKEFTEFLEETVSDYFPGFTVTNALGYWQGEAELTKMLTILTDNPDAERALRTICEVYCARFDQECVLRETVKVESLEYIYRIRILQSPDYGE